MGLLLPHSKFTRYTGYNLGLGFLRLFLNSMRPSYSLRTKLIIHTFIGKFMLGITIMKVGWHNPLCNDSRVNSAVENLFSTLALFQAFFFTDFR